MPLSDWTSEELARFARKQKKKQREIGKRQKEYQARKHHAVLEKLGGKCSKCGDTDLETLHIDEHDKTLSWSPRYNAILKGEVKPKLLCAKCNWKKRHTDEEATGRPRLS